MTYENKWKALISILLLAAVGCARTPAAKRDRFLSRGKELFDKKEYSRARLEFRNAAQAMPGDAEAFYQLGLVGLATGDLGAAAGGLREAVRLNSNHAKARFKLAQLMAGKVFLMRVAAAVGS